MSVLLQHQLGRGRTAGQEAVPGEEGGLGLCVLGHLGSLGGPSQGQEGVEARREISVVVRRLRGREGDPALQGGADGPRKEGSGLGMLANVVIGAMRFGGRPGLEKNIVSMVKV